MVDKHTLIVQPKAIPDPEVPEKTVRRRFAPAYKLRILVEAKQCIKPGQFGALLCREGLYSSNLTLWRRQMQQGLVPKKRGPVAHKTDPRSRRIAELERDNEKLANVILEAYTRKEVLQSMGKRARITAELKYSRDKIIQD